MPNFSACHYASARICCVDHNISGQLLRRGVAAPAAVVELRPLVVEKEGAVGVE